MRAIGRALDEAQKQIRGGKVDPKLLKHLGMSPGQFKSFVEKYTRLYDKVKPSLDRTRRPSGAGAAFRLPGSEKLQRGRSAAGISGVSGYEKLSKDRLRELNEAGIEKVAPKYRKHVEAYFRAISEQSKGGGKRTPKK